MHKQAMSGFTLVEMVVVIIIVAILALVSTTQYVNIQQRTADTERRNDIGTLTNALDKYYYKNKEYPRYFDLRDNGPSILGVEKNTFISPSDVFTSTTAGTQGNGASQYGTSIYPLARDLTSNLNETMTYRYWVPGENVYPGNFTPPNTTAIRNTFILYYLNEEGATGNGTAGTFVAYCGKGDNVYTSKSVITANAGVTALSSRGITAASCSNF